MLTSSKYCIFSQLLDVIGLHSQVKRHVTYIYSEKHFIGYHILFTKHKKLFLFWRNRFLAIPLFFVGFCQCQQKLEVL